MGPHLRQWERQSAVTLFPNPTKGNITLEWNDQLNNINSIQLFSIDGRTLANWTLDNPSNSLALDIAEFGKGVFMLQILADNQLITTLAYPLGLFK